MSVAPDLLMLRGKRLTSWTVTANGQQVQLGFEDEAGHSCAISLPIDLLSALLMTIPRMLQDALHAQCADSTLRMIHPLGNWRVERAAEADAAILSLTTPDGFEVAFAVDTAEADRLGRTLRDSAEPAPARVATVH